MQSAESGADVSNSKDKSVGKPGRASNSSDGCLKQYSPNTSYNSGQPGEGHWFYSEWGQYPYSPEPSTVGIQYRVNLLIPAPPPPPQHRETTLGLIEK